jgi:hypothetical protein
MVVGSGPHLKVITPPFATAATNASPVQLAGEPVPITVVGFDTSSACASGGTTALPSGFPAGGPSCGFVGGVVVPPLVVAPEVPPPLVPPPLVPELPELPPGIAPPLSDVWFEPHPAIPVTSARSAADTEAETETGKGIVKR